MPLVVAGCIKAANAVFNESQNGYQTEIDAFGDCFATEDMKEGTSAFLEKEKLNSGESRIISQLVFHRSGMLQFR